MRIYWWWASFLGLLAFLSVDLWQSGATLPASVVKHFDASGIASGSIAREHYVLTMLITMNLLGIVSAGSLALVTKMPTSMINISNREFWLAPTQRAKTLDYLIRWGILLGAVTALFMWNLHRQIVLAHQSTPPVLTLWTPETVAITIAFSALVATLLLRFSRLPETPRLPNGRPSHRKS
jgi:hypothetical protein